MDTISPVVADAYRLLHSDLYGHLEYSSNHAVASGGDCQTCTSPWPCPVVTTIHALVKDPDREFVALLRRARDDA
jgi:hypothetical protein